MNRFNQLYDIFIMKANREDNSLFVNLGFRLVFYLFFYYNRVMEVGKI